MLIVMINIGSFLCPPVPPPQLSDFSAQFTSPPVLLLLPLLHVGRKPLALETQTRTCVQTMDDCSEFVCVELELTYSLRYISTEHRLLQNE